MTVGLPASIPLLRLRGRSHIEVLSASAVSGPFSLLLRPESQRHIEALDLLKS
jgi:hypothetical protein